MKIFYLLQNEAFFTGRSHTVGGHIAHIIGVVEGFQQLGHKVVIGSRESVPYWNNRQVQYWYFRIKNAVVPKLRVFLTHWRLTNQIKDAIEALKPDMVYVRWAANFYFYRIRQAFPKLPIVVECNTPLNMINLTSPQKGIYRWYFRQIDRQHAESATVISTVAIELRDYLLSNYNFLDPGQVIVNPNGVDAKRFQQTKSAVLQKKFNISPNSVLIGWSGNFRRRHNIPLLIKAFQKLSVDNCYLVIIGTGSEELELSYREMAAQSRQNQIIFTGAINFNEMPSYLSACDILAATLTPEIGKHPYCSPIKLFEYMAVGRAIVASRLGQIEDVIKDGETGLLFTYDSVGELTQVLSRLVRDKTLRIDLGLAARKAAVEKFSWQANVQRILNALPSMQPEFYGGQEKVT